MLADLARVERSPGTPAADYRPSAEDESPWPVPGVSGPAGTPFGDAARAWRASNTAGIDALFAAMGRRQKPEVSGWVWAAEGEESLPVADRNLSPGPHETEPYELAPTPVRTLLGRIYAAVALLLLGPPAFFGLRRAARKPRLPAPVRLAKRSADEPPGAAHTS
jgi:hypothetical protein